MKKNDALKKHHFWILFGLVPLFVLIALIVITSSVGGAIEQREGEIEKEKKDIAGKTNPKSKALLDEMEKMTKKVDGKKGSLHEANWLRQKDLYTWPTSSQFVGFRAKVKDGDKDKTIEVARLEDLRFGDTILNTESQFEEFRKDALYRHLYSDATAGTPGKNGMADQLAPTQFLNGWESILRHVNTWNEIQLTSEQIWLLMEDVWVQRSLLGAIKSVNEQMSEFNRIKYEKPGAGVIDDPDSKNGPHDPLRRKFQSRTWEVALEVAKKGNKQYLIGTLENITDRLQVLGMGKKLTLKVWLEGNTGPDGKLLLGPDGKPDVKGIEPVEFKIGSEFLPGKGGPMKEIIDKEGKKVQVPANVVTEQPNENNDKDLDKYENLLPPGKNVVEIVKVEQVYDTQTVPIRRIDALEMGKTDSRYGDNVQLKPPLFIKPESIDPPPGDPMGGPMGPPMGAGPPVGGRFPGVASAGGGGGPGGAGAGIRSGGGPIESVVMANRKRYVEITNQVRRMPVGLVVVVDHAYIQDVLLALANSPLRFQITQVSWKRFRGNLGTGSMGGSSGGLGETPGVSGPGDFGSGFGGGDDPDMRGGSFGGRRPPGGSGFGPSFGPGGPGFGRLSGPGGLGGVGGIAPPSGGTSPGGGPPYGDSGGGMTTVSEAQLTSGLVELQVYGIVSLYEKYVPPEDPNAVPEKESEPKEKEPKDKNSKEKDPKDPMPMTPTTNKNRVRRRIA